VAFASGGATLAASDGKHNGNAKLRTYLWHISRPALTIQGNPAAGS